MDLLALYRPCVQNMGTNAVKKSNMATPFADPRTGVLYFRRAVPEALRPAFDGKALIKVSLRTKDPAVAKAAFTKENAEFEERLAEARRQLAEGTLLPSPAALVRKWFEGPAVGDGPTGPQRLLVTLMELDCLCGYSGTASKDDIYPPPVFGPAINTDWNAVWRSPSRIMEIITEAYGDDPERVGSNWIRTRWTQSEALWLPYLNPAARRMHTFGSSSQRFSDRDLTQALLDALDSVRPGDEEYNRARIEKPVHKHRPPRLRPTMRLMQLFEAWQTAKMPRPQTALEFKASVTDFIDFAGDIPVSTITPSLIFDYRDEAAMLPATMPRSDRRLPFTQRVAKHAAELPKCKPATLKKRVGAIQSLLSHAFEQQWIPFNPGVGIPILNYTKKVGRRRSFQDHELTALFADPLFTDQTSWKTQSRISSPTIYWLFLICATTGARLEEIGQANIADVKTSGNIVYLDINDYSENSDSPDKSVKTAESQRLVPIHDQLIKLGLLEYCTQLKALGHSQIFPDLVQNSIGKRTKEASQRMNRIVDRAVTNDRRLTFYSLRHAFKAKGNDAGITDKTLDQICGHAPTTVGGQYGRDPRIETIHRELHKIDFSCINWGAIIRCTAPQLNLSN